MIEEVVPEMESPIEIELGEDAVVEDLEDFVIQDGELILDGEEEEKEGGAEIMELLH